VKRFEAIFSIQNENDFNELALAIFAYQVAHSSVYGSYINSLGKNLPRHYSEIPCIPIELFKNHEIISGEKDPNSVVFLSSGTTQISRSKHVVLDSQLYKKSFTKGYEQFIGKPSNQVILALLPNYLEQGHSSLVYMVNELILQTKQPLSGFMLAHPDEVLSRYQRAVELGKQVVLIGVSYALLDLASLNVQLPEAILIETGGMKGRRGELSKEILHAKLKLGTGVKEVYSEYGMTEMLSQAYSVGKDLVFQTPPWMKVLIRETNDPFQLESPGKTGGLNVIDLANMNSCSFIATQDLARLEGNGFQLMGRFDTADIRGCNLMVE
jgi:hypothetical protein